MLITATVPLAGSLVMGWPWLVAAGIAPLLLSAAPCLAMCALGLCMKGMPGAALLDHTRPARNPTVNARASPRARPL